eukprot:2085981-Amphidinium_carterae.1
MKFPRWFCNERGATAQTPAVVHKLFALCCQGIPALWAWSNYGPQRYQAARCQCKKCNTVAV